MSNVACQPPGDRSDTRSQQIAGNRERIDAFVAYLARIEEETPQVFDAHIRESLEHINAQAQDVPAHRADLMKYCFDRCAQELDQSLMHHHSRHKPFGYPGDHEIIDWIYTTKLGPPGRGQLWDRFYHRHA